MKYGFMLFLCFLSRTAIGQPTIEIIGTNSSTSCGNFTILEGNNFQSVTFKVTGDWGDSDLHRFNTPQVKNQDGTVICLMVIGLAGQGDCTVQTILYHTCTCENKTGGVYHFTVTSHPSSPLAAYQMIMTWTKVSNVVTSEAFSVQEVRNETCPVPTSAPTSTCKVNKLCIAINWTGVGACCCVLAVLYYICCKKYEHKTARIVIFVVGLVVCIAVLIGFILCLTVKKCLTTSEEISAGVGISVVCVVYLNFLILQVCKCCQKTKVISKDVKLKPQCCDFSHFFTKGSEKSKPAQNPQEEMEIQSDQPKQSNNSCRKDEKDSSRHDTENDNPKNGGTQDNNSCKSQISLFIVVEEQVFVNSLPAGGTGTENGKKKKALKKKETGDKNKGETSSPKPVKKASIKEGAVGRRGTEDSVEIPHTPLGLESQVSNHQGAAKSAGTDVVRNEKASGDKNSDRPSTTPPESQGKKEGKKALKNEANKNRRNSVPTKPSENQGTNVPENTKKEAWNEHTEKLQKQTGNKDDPQHKNKA